MLAGKIYCECRNRSILCGGDIHNRVHVSNYVAIDMKSYLLSFLGKKSFCTLQVFRSVDAYCLNICNAYFYTEPIL